MKCAASPGGTTGYCIAAHIAVNTVAMARPTSHHRRNLVKRCGRLPLRAWKMWTRGSATLAPDSRHIVAFRSSHTTFRATDQSPSKSSVGSTRRANLIVAQTGRGILRGPLHRDACRGTLEDELD